MGLGAFFRTGVIQVWRLRAEDVWRVQFRCPDCGEMNGDRGRAPVVSCGDDGLISVDGLECSCGWTGGWQDGDFFRCNEDRRRGFWGIIWA